MTQPLQEAKHRHHHCQKTLTSRDINFGSMVALILISVLCITDAIRPSNHRHVHKVTTPRRQPMRRLWYRRLDEGLEDVAKTRRIPSLEKFRRGLTSVHPATDRTSGLFPNTLEGEEEISREALAQELSRLMEGIETLAQEIEATRSIPPMRMPTGPTAVKTPATLGKKKVEKDLPSGSDDSNTVKTANDLRKAVLDEGKELRDIQLDPEAHLLVNATAEELLNHDVIELMVQRFKSGSTPGNRAPDDTARLALSIEGGGMRGAVAAGMASAIACLGLCDTFDAVYGSSAGSVIGSYMISRQMCMDVYVDILPAAKRAFVCTKRIMSALAITAVDMFLSGLRRRRLSYLENRAAAYSKSTATTNNMTINFEEEDQLAIPEITTVLPETKFASRATPGMNISFVLDGIMCDQHGVRPLDMHAFRKNSKDQPLRVASSYAKDGKLYCKTFGSEHFFGPKAVRRKDGKRKGLFACLEPSMTVPGATGPPVQLQTHDGNGEDTLPYFDAFCFEPLPYRSAVDEGATHVLVLCSRPEGFEPKTKPGVYEQAIAPLYFKSHGLPEVADFFAKGGQQYIYLEDMLTLEQGKVAGIKKEGPIPVPPAKLLYGVEQDHENHAWATQRDEKWRKAHLLPMKVPFGTSELGTLEQEQDTVREAVKGGFAVAFDLLAPAIGLNTHHQLKGSEVAELIFPAKAGMLDEIVLREQLRVTGDFIPHREDYQRTTITDAVRRMDKSPSGRRRRMRERRDRFLRNTRHVLRVLARNKQQRQGAKDEQGEIVALADDFDGITKDHIVSPSTRELLLQGGDSAAKLNDKEKADYLLKTLPGLQSGRLWQLSHNLRLMASSLGKHEPDSPNASASSSEDTLRP